MYAQVKEPGPSRNRTGHVMRSRQIRSDKFLLTCTNILHHIILSISYYHAISYYHVNIISSCYIVLLC